MSDLDENLKVAGPSVGLVISTYAAVPYVHVALESWRRHYPEIPVLVKDDCSPQRDELRALCYSYRAEFLSHEKRLGWAAGDMSSLYHGLLWAQRRGLKFLVKMSRRFIPLYNWLPDFSHLALAKRAATFGNECIQSKMKIRTECMGLNTELWSNSGAVSKIRRMMDSLNVNTNVERLIFNLSLEVKEYLHRINGPLKNVGLKNKSHHPFEIWNLVPDKRTTFQPNVLWHNVDRACDYYRIAVLFGLNYSLEEFEDVRKGYTDVDKGAIKKVPPGCGC
jgi:hypothetical protein